MPLAACRRKSIERFTIDSDRRSHDPDGEDAVCNQITVATRSVRCSRLSTRTAIVMTALFAAGAMANRPADAVGAPPEVIRDSTPDGVEFGMWNRSGNKPAPVLFVLAGTIESTLEKPYFRQCGNELADHGWVCVSIDLPCHGTQATDGEPAGLSGWSQLAAKQHDFVAESNARLSRVLDHLIKSGIADPERIVACGTSRGGFLAIHFAAHDTRVKCVAGFAPVTDLAALSEFRAIADSPFVTRLSLEGQAEALAGRPVWIVIGDQDERAGTERAIAFAQKLTAASREKKLDSRIELSVLPLTVNERAPSPTMLTGCVTWRAPLVRKTV